MKKVACYMALMLIVVILIPLIIVRSCGQEVLPETKEGEPQKGITINLYMADQKKIVKVQLEEYLKGVVAAEMPASFEMEALKAQAIAARTYALGRAEKLYGSDLDVTHNGADVCTNPGHCQAWISKDTAMKRWGLLHSFKYWNKVCKAVNETAGQVITYNGVLINPLFHSNSGGHTENVEDVWEGKSVPYLRGVESYGEDKTKEYENTVELQTASMIKTLKEYKPELKLKGSDLLSNMTIKSRSSGGRVMDLQIGNITIKGTEFRKLFELKSTNFKLQKADEDKIKITTLGYGHGVGMSQWGANYLAQNGNTCDQILKYYYQGVETDTLVNGSLK